MIFPTITTTHWRDMFRAHRANGANVVWDQIREKLSTENKNAPAPLKAEALNKSKKTLI